MGILRTRLAVILWLGSISVFNSFAISPVMPNTKSAKHRLRTSLEKRARNRSVKSSLRTVIRKLHETVTAKEFDSARALFPRVTKALDQAAAKGVIHTNKASRLKSRLSAMIKKAAAA
jgi:small subunit ribosomal protein S20